MSAAPHKLPEGIAYPLGIAAGWLYYLGFHAVHAEWGGAARARRLRRRSQEWRVRR